MRQAGECPTKSECCLSGFRCRVCGHPHHLLAGVEGAKLEAWVKPCLVRIIGIDRKYPAAHTVSEKPPLGCHINAAEYRKIGSAGPTA